MLMRLILLRKGQPVRIRSDQKSQFGFSFVNLWNYAAEKASSISRNWKENSVLSTKDLRNDKRLKSLTLLLKCLKIMENATFLSKDNQTHLLGIKGKLSPKASPLLFTELIIVVIKRLSDQCLRQSASAVSGVNKPNDPLCKGLQGFNVHIIL